ncbi:hypothetical protein [Bacteroides sp. Marseille-P3684]|uniref:hypothetical protein n=1 Tax=Bacteroides sp. Marseille-P3684 TaxID=2086579 RepID=UPI000D0B3566|nr:hypothetical protein [Bacteroides sp. Marseille-P3684]
MNMEQWSKEESLLVLDLYLSKPVGMKSVTDETLVDRAQLLGRTPDAFCRRMMQFQQWYPVLPFDAGEDVFGDDNPAVWSIYFGQPKLAHREAAALLKDFCIGTLVLNLYFQLIISTMNEKVPEVMALARQVKRPAKEIVALLHVYAALDPFVKDHPADDLAIPSVYRQLWSRYADDMDKLSRVAKYVEGHYPPKRVRKKNEERK